MSVVMSLRVLPSNFLNSMILCRSWKINSVKMALLEMHFFASVNIRFINNDNRINYWHQFVNRPSRQFSGSLDSISATFSLQLERLFAHDGNEISKNAQWTHEFSWTWIRCSYDALDVNERHIYNSV